MKQLDLLETNISAKFLNRETIHVELNPGGLLSTQLIRELRVMSKARYGAPAKAYIITINDMSEAFAVYSSVCRKTERIEKDVKVAIVCSKTCFTTDARNRESINMRPGAPQLFRTFNAALSWVKAAG